MSGKDGKALRELWRLYHAECRRIHAAWAETGYRHPPPYKPAFPEVLRGLACGAKTRAGTPCKQVSIYANGRCKLHGGLSTGPTTAAGKAKSASNGKTPKKQSP